MKWWEVLLELIKFTAPALIVFFTIQYLLKEFFQNERHNRAMKDRSENRSEVLPLKLQAYERLALLCERIKIPSLVMRLQQTSVSAHDLQAAMLITIQQEFEHNIAQQIYVSQELWKIIDLAKNQTISFITSTRESMPDSASSADFVQALFANLDKIPNQPSDTALMAIKKEISLIL